MPVFQNEFYEIAAILFVAVVSGAIALRLRQPLLIAFIAVGILVGPSGLNWVGSSEQVNLLAEMGITLLLFVVGLKLDPHEIRSVGAVAIAVGVGQMLLTGVIGYGISLGFGLSWLEAFYVAIGLTFSSTIIIVKLLSDRKEIDSLHGRIAVGVLIIQDITVVLVMIGLSALNGSESSEDIPLTILSVVLKGAVFLALIAVVSRYILPPALHELARSQELLVLSAIAWAIALASGADLLGFSKEMGAFLAGVAIASTPYRVPISTRLTTLRDFLLFFFFIDLGVHIDVQALGQQVWPAIVLSAFVLLGKPLMVITLMGRMGYRKYTSALTGLSLSQISEFSLILAALGVSLGHIDQEVLGLITLVGLITMAVSTYLILDSHSLYARLAPALSFCERAIAHLNHREHAADHPDTAPVEVIVFGLGRYGGRLIQNLKRNGVEVFGVDFDPEIVVHWRNQGFKALYGDADDPELPGLLPLEQARWVVSTLPDCMLGLTLLHTLRTHRFKGNIALTSHNQRDEAVLIDAGADLVLLPFRDAANQASHMLSTQELGTLH
jgi:Kef-type K+ transport system membrane component KefB